jgi:hypothetical protein
VPAQDYLFAPLRQPKMSTEPLVGPMTRR